MKWSSRQYLVAFNMVPGIGGRRLMALHEHFGSLATAWHAPQGAWAQVNGIGPKIAERFCSLRSSLCPHQEEEWALRHGAQIITLADKSYPDYLKRLAVPPPVLYVLGSLPKKPGIAVVGTRKPSRVGIAQARHFSAHIVRQGVALISGLARGIDYFSHQQAVELQAPTVAVLGSNIANLYPAEHRGLVEQIVQTGGAVVSEFSSKCTTVPGNFPRRNRIIAGCSKGVLVVQAGKKSGALRTADWALELGLDVWAIPGEITDPLREGTHQLIKQGAYLVTEPEEVLASTKRRKAIGSRTVEDLYKAGLNANEIAATLGQPISKVLAQISLYQVQKENEN